MDLRRARSVGDRSALRDEATDARHQLVAHAPKVEHPLLARLLRGGEELERPGQLLAAGTSSGGANGVSSHCPFVESYSCAVAWHGGVSPCLPLLHTYTCFVRGREKRMTRWEVGSLPSEPLAAIWAKPAYAAFRERVRRFDFPPCTDCGCELAEGNEEDCLGNAHPVCGDCLWARGIVSCA